MDITELISPGRVVAGLETTSKKRLLEQISQLLSTHEPVLTPEEIFDSLVGRERLGSTGLGQGVALPHGRVANIEHPFGAFARLATPIDFDAIDQQPVDLVFALLVPTESTEEHLQILANLAKHFSDPEFCQRLRQAEDDQTLYDSFIQWADRHRETA